MFTPPNSHQTSGSFDDILKRMISHMQQDQIDDQVIRTLQQAFEKELVRENVMLSRPERVRLYRQASRSLLNEVLVKIEGPK